MTPPQSEFGRNVRTSIWMSALSAGGKAIAIAKTVAIAAIFGVSGQLDAFWVAFVIPNILPLFLRSAFVTSFVPFFLRRRGAADGDESALWQAASVLFTGALAVSAAASLLVYGWPEAMVRALAPGLKPQVEHTAAQLLQITVVILLLVVASSMLTAVSHCRQRFFAASLEGLTTNTTVVVAIGVMGRDMGVEALAVATVAGFAVHLAVMIYACREEIRRYLRPSWRFTLPLFREYLGGVWPVLIGALSGIAMGVISQVFISYLDVGSVSVYQYAMMVALLPVEIFAGSIQATFFPTIAKYSVGNLQAVVQAHAYAVRILVFVMVPVSAVLMAMDEHVVRVLFGRGQFGEASIGHTAVVLTCLGIGITGRAVTYFNFQVLHAIGKPWSQVTIGLLQLAMNAGLSAVLMRPFGLAGIAAAGSLSLLVSVFVSYRVLKRQLGSAEIAQAVRKPAAQTLVIGVATFAILKAGLFMVDIHALFTSRWAYAAGVAAVATAGFGLFFLMAMALRMDEAAYVTKRLARRIGAQSGG
jgi:putative peptidoglycan lipid II flippase